ncbi:hypothetical protein QJS66_05335 [Kocuria rhizophila]|nr:hypothetical protein QJS66_05335 [Kocuria rhizophila]
MAAYEGTEAPLNLLFAPEFVKSVDALPAWRRVVARAVEHGIPAPVSGALRVYDALRRPRLNAALTRLTTSGRTRTDALTTRTPASTCCGAGPPSAVS